MRRLGIAYHESFLKHDPGPGHPDRPQRIRLIMDEIKRAEWADRVDIVEAREATQEEVGMNHDARYVEAMRRLCDAGGEFLPSLQAAVGEETYPAALRGVGGGLTLIDGILAGEWTVGFVPTRPPGHHAVFARPMGFCVFNNIAVAARDLIRNRGMERVCIVDFDVHHGSGTERSFWTEPKVLVCSLHRDDHFPSNSGDWHNIGEGAGEGFTVNVPLPAKSDDDDHLRAMDRYIAPRVAEFKPEIILVSAGFDGHWRDIIGGMKLTGKGYAGFGARIRQWADEWSDGRVLVFLEGGYDLEGLIEGTLGFLGELIQ